MTASKWLPVVGVVLLWSGSVVAQDPAKVSPGTYKVILDNPTVRVFRVTGAPGNKVAAHAHPDHLAIALAPGKVQIVADGKTQTLDMANETASYVPAGTHESSNAGTVPLDAIVVELKAPAGKAQVPPVREGMNAKLLAEGPKAVAHRMTAEANVPGTCRHETRVRTGRHRARTVGDVSLDRRQARQDTVDAW